MKKEENPPEEAFDKGRNTIQREKVMNAIKKYGAARMLADVDKYAQELDVSTQQRYGVGLLAINKKP